MSKEKQVPSAEEFFNSSFSTELTLNNQPVRGVLKDNAVLMLQEFAKLHVQAALKAASEKATIVYAKLPGKKPSMFRPGEITEAWTNKESILSAYDLNEIK